MKYLPKVRNLNGSRELCHGSNTNVNSQVPGISEYEYKYSCYVPTRRHYHIQWCIVHQMIALQHVKTRSWQNMDQAWKVPVDLKTNMMPWKWMFILKKLNESFTRSPSGVSPSPLDQSPSPSPSPLDQSPSPSPVGQSPSPSPSPRVQQKSEWVRTQPGLMSPTTEKCYILTLLLIIFAEPCIDYW